MIKIHNTLKNKLEKFVPRNEIVKLYVCGPGVYDNIHVGNARPVVFFDVVRRYLELFYEVFYVQNFTDIDDKVIDAAKKEDISIFKLTERYIDEFFLDSDKLNVKRADLYPKATDYVPQIIESISILMDKGYAYVSEDGVYYKVEEFKEYGKLSNRRLEDMVSTSERTKENSFDFALWKFEEDESISWESPWGRGRPGWHIECSAMVNHNIKDLDIHGGGQDLIFPHHENEIAQSEAIIDCCFSNYWMHNGFVQMDNMKMSKSQGNLLKVKNLISKYGGNVVRLFLLSTHYRKHISFSDRAMEASSSAINRIKSFVRSIEDVEMVDDGYKLNREIDSFKISFYNSMDDDFNTPGALGAIFEAIKSFNSLSSREILDSESLIEFKKEVFKGLDTLGFIFKDNKEKNMNTKKLVDLLLDVREDARKDRNWKLSDKIRDELKKIGIEIKDGQKTTWTTK